MTRPGGRWRTWGRTLSVRPRSVERPSGPEAVERAVRSALERGRRIKPIGAGHSFSAIAEAPDVLLDMDGMSGVIRVDRDRLRVTLGAGTRLWQIPGLLAPYGLAMPNLGDIDRQSIAGAISTGTHGTGLRFGGIATQVVGVRLVTGDGGVRVVDEDHDPHLLPAVALALGALGVLVDVTLQCVPAFVLHAEDRPEPLDRVLEDLDARVRGADHFEFYWFPHTDRAMTRTNTRLPESSPRQRLSRTAAWIDEVVLGSGAHAAACAIGWAVPPAVPSINRVTVRVWGDRQVTDSSADVFVARRAVRFREMEYAVPIDAVGAAFDAVRELIRRRRWRIGFPLEVRFAQADDLWLSTASGRTSAYIAVHRYWREDPTAYFREVEEILRAHGGRPHWGKMHTAEAADLRPLYPRFDRFRALQAEWDPAGLFRNDYLDRVLGGTGDGADRGRTAGGQAVSIGSDQTPPPIALRRPQCCGNGSSPY